ncbi:methyltransferase domain-containing protein [Kitasatospora sp. NPDC004799]|uniref:class I SAM-dependent methyltransferase n=1 Tax=Kitasatospora sp. NPDC004799 TaxID=3154460 RepID=UPI0033ACD596
MALGRLLHGDPQHDTDGTAIGCGRGYELFTTVAFGGRRDRVFTRLAALSGAGPGDRVLDVGCGTGYLTRRMATAVAPDGTALGVDPSDRVVDHARRLAADLSGCTFERGIAEELAAPDASFDVVVTSLMIHHLPAGVRPQALAEMYRVCRPGGRLLVADFRPPESRIGRHLVGAAAGPAMERNPIERLDGLVRDAGFTVVGVGDLRPWMRYVTAVRPAARQDPV